MRIETRIFAALALVLMAASAGANEPIDLQVVHRIKSEASARGQVMDHLFWLTDANGPRLTNSPGFRAADEWAVKTVTSWGASNAHLEKWGQVGRGWSLQRFSINLVRPVYAPLHVARKAWSGITHGPVST